MRISKELRVRLAHFLAALIIVVKGVDKIDHHHPVGGGILIGIGIIIGLMVIWHHRLASYIKSFDAMMYLGEAIVLGIVSWLYFQDGKKALPLAYVVATLGYLVASYRTYQRDKHHPPAHH